MINDDKWVDGYKIKIFNFGKYSIFNPFIQRNSLYCTFWLRFINDKAYSRISNYYEVTEAYYTNNVIFNLQYLKIGNNDNVFGWKDGKWIDSR